MLLTVPTTLEDYLISEKGTQRGSSLSWCLVQNLHSVFGTLQPSVGDALDFGREVGDASVSPGMEFLSSFELCSPFLPPLDFSMFRLVTLQ